MNNRTVLSISKIHTFAQLSSSDKHNTRQELTAENIDTTKIYNNKILVSTDGLSFSEKWKEKFNQKEIEIGHPIKNRKNAVLALEIITGFSHEMSDKIDLDEWGKKNVEWIKEQFGEDNIVSSIMHLDESSPHIHTIVIPFKDDRLNAKAYTGGKVAMYNLQTSYANKMADFGLVRGRKKSKAKRKMLDRFYSSVDEIEKMGPPAIGASESIDQYVKRIEESNKTYALAALNLKQQLVNEKLDRDEIIMAQMSKYEDAINLYEELVDRYDGDICKAKQRVNQYRKIEMAVPKPALQKLLDGMLQKFDLFQSLEFKRLNDKKKKRLMRDPYKEDIPETIGEIPASFGENNILDDTDDIASSDDTASALYNIK